MSNILNPISFLDGGYLHLAQVHLNLDSYECMELAGIKCLNLCSLSFYSDET